MKLTKKLRIHPVKTYESKQFGISHEMVMIYDGDFPAALVHVDSLLHKGEGDGAKEIYDLAYKKGQDLEMTIMIEVPDATQSDRTE